MERQRLKFFSLSHIPQDVILEVLNLDDSLSTRGAGKPGLPVMHVGVGDKLPEPLDADIALWAGVHCLPLSLRIERKQLDLVLIEPIKARTSKSSGMAKETSACLT